MTTDSISYSEAVETARDYYNSADADAFYANVWGGEDIHVGFYEGADDTIADASRRTVERLAAVLGPPGDASRVLDMGSGYGGMARYLAATCRCNVVGLNLSEVENDRARRLNAEQGLDDLVEIVDGSYDSVPSEAGGFDAVCSQDALLHSDKRDAVVAEAARVLKPGGLFAFTDIMQADSCPQLPPRPRDPRARKRQIDALLEHVRQRGEVLGVDPRLVTSRAELKELFGAGENALVGRMMKGWRKEFLGDLSGLDAFERALNR